MVEVSKNILKYRLNLGENILLDADGISGMFSLSNNKNEECIELKNRKGVSKLALETGCHIIPCYGFGNTIVYKPVYDPWGFMKKLSKRLKIGLIGISGRWGFTTKKKKSQCIILLVKL